MLAAMKNFKDSDKIGEESEENDYDQVSFTSKFKVFICKNNSSNMPIF